MSVIFNKNHITISKNKNLDRKKDTKFFVRIIKDYGDKIQYSKNTNSQVVKTRKKSKLGFWYWTEQKTYDENTICFIRVILCLSNNSYEVIYPYKTNDQYIGVDIRPWDIIPGDGQFEEHYMKDLLNDLNNMLNEILDCSGTILYESYCENSYMSKYPISDELKPSTVLKKLKAELFTDIFGSSKGIRFQTDSEKLLSHGFDIKKSFRKRKEE